MAQPRLSGHVCLLSHKGLSTPATSHPIFVRVCAGNLHPQGGGLASVCTSVWKETGTEKCQINWCVSAPCGRQRRGARRRVPCLSLTVSLFVFLAVVPLHGRDALANTCKCKSHMRFTPQVKHNKLEGNRKWRVLTSAVRLIWWNVTI